VQIAFFGIAALILAFFLMRMGGGDPEPTSTTTAAGASPTGPGSAPPPLAAVPASPSTPQEAAPAVPPAGGESVAIERSAGLPGRFVSAYNDDRAIALLIVSRQAHTDRVIEDYAAKAVGDSAELIVIADERISDYSAVVEGLNVNRTPALVVIRPQSLSAGAPSGAVLYGFRSPRSIRQGIEDALYDGPARNYSP